MFSHHRAVHGAQLGAGLIEGGAGRQAAEQLGHAMDAPGDHGGRKMMRAGHHVGDDLGFGGYGTDGSSTPTMVAERAPSRTVLPITDGSLFSAFVQKR